MKTLIATATLTVMFLSAGAFASDNHRTAITAQPQKQNVTVIMKNQAWPVAETTADPCAATRCYEI